MMQFFTKNKLTLFILGIVFSVVLLSFKRNDDIASEVKNYKTEYVVVLIIDGPRYSETFGDSTYEFIPNLANILAPQGVLVRNFRNEGSTYTNAGHTAITTGVYQKINNAGLELPRNPSMFQYYLKEKNLDSTKAWVIASKGKLSILTDTKDKKWHDQYEPADYCGVNGKSIGYADDAKTLIAAKGILTQFHPNLTLINLLEVDVKGHANLWKEYLQAIKNTDQMALDLWSFIQADETYKNKTTLFITNDHGRHLDCRKNGFQSHGDNCEGCRTMYLIALGPDFKTNTVLYDQYEQIDISSTIAELLNFNFPVSRGEIMTDLFK